MFWQEFEETFGEIGRDPVGLYRYEVGHVLRVSPDEFGELTPSVMVNALGLFNHIYRSGNG